MGNSAESRGCSIDKCKDRGNKKERKAQAAEAKNEIKELKRDLHRKDKALAELTALLILKKKADYLWGDSEDD